jgi:hypothetical protein
VICSSLQKDSHEIDFGVRARVTLAYSGATGSSVVMKCTFDRYSKWTKIVHIRFEIIFPIAKVLRTALMLDLRLAKAA